MEKLLFFKASNFKAAFFPISRLTGITHDNGDGGNLRFLFKNMKDIDPDVSSESDHDEVLIKFTNELYHKDAVTHLWERLHTSKDVVYTVADVSTPETNTPTTINGVELVGGYGFGDHSQYIDETTLADTVQITIRKL